VGFRNSVSCLRVQFIDSIRGRLGLARLSGGDQPNLCTAWQTNRAPLTSRGRIWYSRTYKSDMDGGLLQQIGDVLANEHPAASVEALLGGWGEQPEQLRQGVADVALLYEPFDQKGLAFELLIEEPRLVALPTAHPLAGRDVVSLSRSRRSSHRLLVPTSGKSALQTASARCRESATSPTCFNSWS
jgi:LysR substrate binding domain